MSAEPKPAKIEPMIALLSPMTENWPLAKAVPVDRELLARLAASGESPPKGNQ